MSVKDIVIAFLKEKQNQLMEQYTEWEYIRGEFPEDYELCQQKMDRCDGICELIHRKIYELEEG